MQINYDFADLEAFLAVKETESFNKAAEKLNTSQSAITRRVQKLESALDTVLFERTTRMVRPTLAAKRLQSRAEAMLEEAREATRAIRDESVALSHQRRRVLTIAIIPTAVEALLLPAIRNLSQNGFRMRFQILDRAANEVSESVAQAEAEIGISSLSNLDANTEFELLFEDEMALALPAEHRLSLKEQILWEDLQGESLILPARRTGNRMLIDDAIARAGASLSWMFEVERSTTALALVAHGFGIAPLPRSVLRFVQDERIAWRALGDPVIKRPIGMLSRLGQVETSEIAELKRAVRSAI